MATPAGVQPVPLRLHTRPPASPETGESPLARELRARVAGEVRFDTGTRALYATDASNYRQVPLGVVVPRDAGDVELTLASARRHGAAVLGRGGGTSLAGQTCNTGVVLDFSKYMNRILAIDPDRRQARVEPGVVLDALREAASVHGLTFGPDPATHEYCTLGGMIGNNSCGVRSVMAEHYGPGPTTAHNVDRLEVITYDGIRLSTGATDDEEFARVQARGGRPAEIYRMLRSFQQKYAGLIRQEFPDISRRVSGYNLPALLPENGFNVARALVGSESTLALVLEATVSLIPSLPKRVLVVLGYEDVFAAADHVPDVVACRPVGVEGMDRGLADDLRRSGLAGENLALLPEGDGWLFVEFGGRTQDEALERAREAVDRLRRSSGAPSLALFETPEEQERLWEVRESGLAATARVSGRNPTWPGWEDSAVPRERLGEYLRDLRKLFDEHGYDADLYGHFGQGCVHCRVDFDLRTAEGIGRFREFMEQAAALVHRYGGSLSGEHGDGQARGELLSRMFSSDMMNAFREFKRIWDPDGRMNPGKVIDARPIDADLRFGTSYDPPVTSTWFQYPDDLGSFAHAAARCVGVGKCRKTETGTMCPSYMVTHEEKHTTRGRARLLFEMLEGDPLEAGWRAEYVREALDLCLACKGCKGECPVHVDMATYKAEFLAHYYEHRPRPRAAYAFGLIGTWARLIARLSLQRLVNTAAAAPGLRELARLAAGIAPERAIPAFAARTYREWAAARVGTADASRPRVILWPDTFNDHFHPETLIAAHEVLEELGYRVTIPQAPLCCGRPLYEYGQLDRARARLQEILTALSGDIRDGTPIVCLEPSCVSVFRDELVGLFPRSEQARRLQAQTFTLAEIVDRHPDRIEAMRLERRALFHAHCHHRAIMHTEADHRTLQRLGVDFDALDSGCCGMAGAFGFEAEHYDVSMAVGERVLLPAVRSARRDALIITDGFSCREQIAQTTDRRALHLAQVLQLALRQGPRGPSGDLPERAAVVDHREERLSGAALAGAGLLVAGLVLGFGVLRGARKRRRVEPHA